MSALNRWEGFLTLGGIGHRAPAAGTVASIAAIPFAWACHALGGFWLMGPVTVAIALLGYLGTRELLAARETPDADPQEVVIDEVAGMMIALWPLSIGLTVTGADWWVWPWPGVLAAFVLFRALDILKPPPINWCERAPGAVGVMLDDLVAGALSALIAAIAAGVAHGWF